MKKIVGLGACVLDTLINCDKYPKEDTKQKAESVFVSGGGPVGNALVVLSKLGVKTEVIGGFGSDNAGKYILDDFRKYRVGVEKTTIVEHATSFVSYIILSALKATRTCVFDRGSVPDNPDSVCLSAIDDANILHLDGNYLECALKAAEYAKSRGVKVSLDAGGLYFGIERLLPYVDILIPSAEFALGIACQDSVQAAMRVLNDKFSPEILVVTDGGNGGYYWKHGQAVHYDSVKVKAVDTNGAGDTFHGAFLAAYCEGKSIDKCCEFASKVAAYKCTQKGVRTCKLTREMFE